MSFNFRRHFLDSSLRKCKENYKYLIDEERWIVDEVEKLGMDTVLLDEHQQLRNDLNDITRRLK